MTSCSGSPSHASLGKGTFGFSVSRSGELRAVCVICMNPSSIKALASSIDPNTTARTPSTYRRRDGNLRPMLLMSLNNNTIIFIGHL
eukprot:4662950-Pyramimonas_sp.AAC.2